MTVRRHTWRAAALAVLIGVAALTSSAVPASAGVVTEPEHTLVRTPGLTAAERRAITPTSISTVRDPSIGLIVTATFRGDVEHDLGSGALAQGCLALVLVQAPTSTSTAPPGVLACGGGLTPTSFPILERGGGGSARIARGTVQFLGPQWLLPTAGVGAANVTIVGNKVIFAIGGPAGGQVSKIRLKVFARRPAAVRLGARHPRTVGAAAWNAVVVAGPAVQATVAVDQTVLSTVQLQTLAAQLSSTVSSRLAPELRRQQHAGARLAAAVRSFKSISRVLAKHHRKGDLSRRELVADVANANQRLTRLRTEVAAVGELTDGIQPLIASSQLAPVTVVQTDPTLSEEMANQPERGLSEIAPQGVPVIDVDEQVRYQQFEGLGAALTDSSAWLIGNALAPQTRLALLQALFGAPGTTNVLGAPAIHLNFLRLAIGASGAMTAGAPYSYDDMPPGQSDPDLSQFSIAHDLPYTVPTVQQALAINPALQILANPWSPPAWMKANDALDNSGGNGTLLASAYRPLANYFVDFIEAYERLGIPIAALTPQNEPSSGGTGVSYPGLTLAAGDEARFIADDLAPALRAAGLATKIYGNDLSWNSLSYVAGLTGTGAAADLAGIAWHCYFGSPTVMSQLHQAAPGLDQIVDECSPEIRPTGTPEYLISSLRNWASVVAVWALALDPAGGPIQPLNDCPGCTGPVTIDEQTGAVTLRPEYYQLGQVSAFVDPGAWRIDSQASVSYGVNSANMETASSGLDDVAFQNPDGSLVLVANNTSRAPITFAVQSDGRYFTYTIPARAMTTLVWN
jgi:glucosylceramidase